MQKNYHGENEMVIKQKLSSVKRCDVVLYSQLIFVPQSSATEKATKPYFDGIISRFYDLYQAGETTALSLVKQLVVVSQVKKRTNNNNEIKQEDSLKQKGCQFKLSLPVIVDRSGRSFLYASSSQGVKVC
ncbi:MAG: hypothetical protein A2103_05370 [Gammaproteobacteria bacterium GWF2_41_13]|nr:MAG: hypothetical protein A2103_05370 [Gammaproteobacteria bacterium GWF2_41_13]